MRTRLLTLVDMDARKSLDCDRCGNIIAELWRIGCPGFVQEDSVFALIHQLDKRVFVVDAEDHLSDHFGSAAAFRPLANVRSLEKQCMPA